jgi:hypothetical protein
MANELIEQARNAVIAYVSADGALTASLSDLRTAISTGDVASAQKAQAEVDNYKAQVESAKATAASAISAAQSAPGADGSVFDATSQANAEEYSKIKTIFNKETSITNKNISEASTLQTRLAEVTSTQANEKKTATEATDAKVEADAKTAGTAKPTENKKSDDNSKTNGSVTVSENNPYTGVIRVDINGVGSSGDASKKSKPNRRTYNPLSKFSSYTYNISLYAITPDAYNEWTIGGKWITKNLSLLIQSGGITQGAAAVRNEFFDLDFTIDDLEIVSLINGKSTMHSSNQSNLKFKIYEPFGMTFPTRLVRAQTQVQQNANIGRDIKQQVQALNTPLLLVIRFYGYDEEGKPIQAMTDPEKNGYTKTDSNASFERAFPILISKFSFRLENKVTVYDIEAKMINEQIGLGVKRGTIKTPLEITGSTVDAAITALMNRVNRQQEDLIKDPENPKQKSKQKIADYYRVRFEDKSDIPTAEIVSKDFYVKRFTPMVKVTNSSQVNDKTSNSGDAKTVNTDERIINIAAGTSILTAIDQIITQSTYVTKALEQLDKEEIAKKQKQDSTTTENDKPIELFWYHVKPTIKYIRYDKGRNDYAYEVTYNILKYRIPYIQSLYLDRATKYHGPHKIYEYYYTGKNTEIIDFSCNFNLGYYNLGSLTSNAANNDNPNDTTPNSQEPGQDADPTGALPGARELINSYKTYLYSPKDLLDATLSILGDPDYLMPSQAGSEEDLFRLWYGPDFTINPSSGQVFIEVGMKEVEDYTHFDGELTPKNNIVFWAYPEGSDIQKQTEGRMVYMLTHVTSRFSNGLFRQELKSIIPSFSNQPAGSNNTSGLRTDENQSQAETDRLLRNKPTKPTAKPPINLTTTTNIMKNVTNTVNPSTKDDNTLSHKPGIKIDKLTDPFREVGKNIDNKFRENTDFIKKNLFNNGN